MPTAGSPRRWQAHALALATALLATLCEQAVVQQSPSITSTPWALVPLALVGCALAGTLPALTLLLGGLALSWLAGATGMGTPPAPAALLAEALLGGGLLLLMARRLHQLRQSVLKAEEAEHQQRQIVEKAGLGLFELDLQHRSLQASPRFAEMLQLPWSPAPQPLDAWLAQLPESSARRLREVLGGLAAGPGRFFLHELDLSDADGLPYWVLLCGQVSPDAETRHTRVQGAGIDISARKRAEVDLQGAKAALGEQLEDLRRLHELSSRLLAPGTVEEQLHQVLATALEIHHSGAGLISVLEDGRARVRAEAGFSDIPPEELERLVNDGGICGMAMKERARLMVQDMQDDPRCRPIRALMAARGLRAAHALPLISDQGELMGAMSLFLEQARLPNARERTAMDMCANKAVLFIERARARAALQASELRFESVLDASAVPFGVLSPVRDGSEQLEDFRLDYLNAAAVRALKGRREQLIGRPVQDILVGVWQRRPDLLAQCQRALLRNETCEFEFSAPEGGRGLEQHFHCIVSPMGHSLAVWAANVSDRRRHDQQLRDADRRKDEFIATLAHELRNLLAPIRQAAHLSSATEATEEQKRWGNELIDRQVRHMALLLDDLLDISRIARGALLLRLDRAELGSIINNAVEAVRPLIDAKQHHLHLDLPRRPLRFDADALRLSQVVANLLSNAAKYTEPGGEIRLRARAGKGELCIEVSDNGIGMPPESLGDVFHMYTRLGSGDEGKPGGGLGIGLALARGLVALHGGSIAAASDGPGCGSCFTVRIPLLHVSQPGPREPAPAQGWTRPQTARPVHVLIADDNEEAAQSLSALLQMHGHRVSCAYDGEQAVAAFRADPADVCLLDIGMPVQDGKEVARAIRALPGGERPMLIAITGWGQEADRREAIAAGFDHHLTKPVDPEHVLRLIASAPLQPRSTEISAP